MTSAQSHLSLVFDDFELDAERLELRRGGKLVKVDQVVLRLLARLLRSPGQLVTKDELVEDVWEGRAVADTAITVSMARLRKALGDRRGEREVVVTVHGRGYRFARPVVTRSSAHEPRGSAPDQSEPPFVGRERVLQRLRHALDEARQGRGRLVVLLGEPGIGKTRAVEAFERELAGTDARVVWGFCREAGDTPPLWPWLRLRRELIASTASAAGSATNATGSASPTGS
ncbi:MAG TPA: AAA family ATPase, partial [Polyangiales bacterium]|nr:AAA family ATPase [Polyangiales bacterium]